MSDRTSGGVADELVPEEVLNDVGPMLGRAEVGADAADHLVAGCGPLATEGVGLDVVVEKLVGVEVGAVGRQEEVNRPGFSGDSNA